MASQTAHQRPSPYLSTALTTAPYLTWPVAPVNGCIKQRHDDFLVEELPLYEPDGEGEHIYLLVQKSGLSTTELVAALAAHFNVKKRDIGFAGMKDKRAVTRQVISIHTPGKSPEDFPMLQHDDIQILWTDLHTNKLRRGHLRGNGFSIRIRDCDPTRVRDAHRVLRHLETKGLPNFYGDQRFGARLNNHVLGRFMIRREHKQLLDEMLGPDPDMPSFNPEARAAYLEGDYETAFTQMPGGLRTERRALDALRKGMAPADAIARTDELQRQFWVSAWQSAIFNRVLARRMEDGTLGTILPGDIAVIHDTGAMFRVDQQTADDPETRQRAERFEISPTGPIWGSEMMTADGKPGRDEAEELAAEGIDHADLERITKDFGPSAQGTRRALRTAVMNPDVEGGADEHGTFIRAKFELASGCFATSVMREIMKTFPLECTHIARRGGHELVARDPAEPPRHAREQTA